MDEINLFKGLSVERRILKPFKIGDRLFFPIVEIMIMGGEKSFNSLNVSPVAFLVKQNDYKYVIPLNKGGISEIEFQKLFESSK